MPQILEGFDGRSQIAIGESGEIGHLEGLKGWADSGELASYAWEVIAGHLRPADGELLEVIAVSQNRQESRAFL